tara:strand:+ start:1053 stop:1772 length:720 start_codon:yes stop_codon:yes gene_type:complete
MTIDGKGVAMFTGGVFPKLSSAWLQALGAEFKNPYMKGLESFLTREVELDKVLYPPLHQVFSAFDAAPLKKVKVVVLGQDPYHGVGLAHGLSFSVAKGVRIPPSLINIYKEVVEDVSVNTPSHGCLQSWARQGVLLLNAVLTVEQGVAGSHQGRGWELFTDAVINLLNAQSEGLVFMLWGAYAQKKGRLIDESRHLVLRAPHPSPLSAYRGFFGCRHFSQANNYLLKRGCAAIDWSVPD